MSHNLRHILNEQYLFSISFRTKIRLKPFCRKCFWRCSSSSQNDDNGKKSKPNSADDSIESFKSKIAAAAVKPDIVLIDPVAYLKTQKNVIQDVKMDKPTVGFLCATIAGKKGMLICAEVQGKKGIYICAEHKDIEKKGVYTCREVEEIVHLDGGPSDKPPTVKLDNKNKDAKIDKKKNKSNNKKETAFHKGESINKFLSDQNLAYDDIKLFLSLRTSKNSHDWVIRKSNKFPNVKQLEYWDEASRSGWPRKESLYERNNRSTQKVSKIICCPSDANGAESINNLAENLLNKRPSVRRIEPFSTIYSKNNKKGNSANEIVWDKNNKVNMKIIDKRSDNAQFSTKQVQSFKSIKGSVQHVDAKTTRPLSRSESGSGTGAAARASTGSRSRSGSSPKIEKICKIGAHISNKHNPTQHVNIENTASMNDMLREAISKYIANSYTPTKYVIIFDEISKKFQDNFQLLQTYCSLDALKHKSRYTGYISRIKDSNSNSSSTIQSPTEIIDKGTRNNSLTTLRPDKYPIIDFNQFYIKSANQKYFYKVGLVDGKSMKLKPFNMREKKLTEEDNKKDSVDKQLKNTNVAEKLDDIPKAHKPIVASIIKTLKKLYLTGKIVDSKDTRGKASKLKKIKSLVATNVNTGNQNIATTENSKAAAKVKSEVSGLVKNLGITDDHKTSNKKTIGAVAVKKPTNITENNKTETKKKKPEITDVTSVQITDMAKNDKKKKVTNLIKAAVTPNQKSIVLPKSVATEKGDKTEKATAKETAKTVSKTKTDKATHDKKENLIDLNKNMNIKKDNTTETKTISQDINLATFLNTTESNKAPNQKKVVLTDLSEKKFDLENRKEKKVTDLTKVISTTKNSKAESTKRIDNIDLKAKCVEKDIVTASKKISQEFDLGKASKTDKNTNTPIRKKAILTDLLVTTNDNKIADKKKLKVSASTTKTPDVTKSKEREAEVTNVTKNANVEESNGTIKSALVKDSKHKNVESLISQPDDHKKNSDSKLEIKVKPIQNIPSFKHLPDAVLDIPKELNNKNKQQQVQKKEIDSIVGSDIISIEKKYEKNYSRSSMQRNKFNVKTIQQPTQKQPEMLNEDKLGTLPTNKNIPIEKETKKMPRIDEEEKQVKPNEAEQLKKSNNNQIQNPTSAYKPQPSLLTRILDYIRGQSKTDEGPASTNSTVEKISINKEDNLSLKAKNNDTKSKKLDGSTEGGSKAASDGAPVTKSSGVNSSSLDKKSAKSPNITKVAPSKENNVTKFSKASNSTDCKSFLSEGMSLEGYNTKSKMSLTTKQGSSKAFQRCFDNPLNIYKELDALVEKGESGNSSKEVKGVKRRLDNEDKKFDLNVKNESFVYVEGKGYVTIPGLKLVETISPVMRKYSEPEKQKLESLDDENEIKFEPHNKKNNNSEEK